MYCVAETAAACAARCVHAPYLVLLCTYVCMRVCVCVRLVSSFHERAVQPAAVVACSLNICGVNTNSTKASLSSGQTLENTVCKRLGTHHSSMQKIELSSRRTVSITPGCWGRGGRGGWGGPEANLTAIHHGRSVASGRWAGLLLASSRSIESLIIVKCQCESTENSNVLSFQTELYFKREHFNYRGRRCAVGGALALLLLVVIVYPCW